MLVPVWRFPRCQAGLSLEGFALITDAVMSLPGHQWHVSGTPTGLGAEEVRDETLRSSSDDAELAD